MDPKTLADDEPRGASYGEPREDDLNFDADDACWRRADGRYVCGARRNKQRWKENWARCRQPTDPGTRCRFHGGKTPVGQAAPSFKHGRYSQFVPRNLRERYESFRDDKEIAHLRDAIALLDTRIAEVLEGIDVGASEERYRNVRRLHRTIVEERERMRTAQEAGDRAASTDAFNTLLDSIDEVGHVLDAEEASREAWAEITKLIDERRKVARAELQRIVKSEQVVNVEEAVSIMASLSETVRRLIDLHVPEEERQEAKSYMQQSVNAIYSGRTKAQA